MRDDPFNRHRKLKLALGVTAIGLVVSVLVGVMLFFISRIRPHY